MTQAAIAMPEGDDDRPKNKRRSKRSRQPRNQVDLLQELRSGRQAPRSITRQERKALVTSMSDDGCSVPTIAKVLDYSERQVWRIKAEVRKERALSFSPERTAEFAGQFEARLEAAFQRLRSAAKSAEATPRDRILAERAICEVFRSQCQGLQSMGYLNKIHARDAKQSEPTRDAVAAMIYADVMREAIEKIAGRVKGRKLRRQLGLDKIDLDGLLDDLEDEVENELNDEG